MGSLVAPLSLRASPASAGGEPASWFVYRSDTLEVHVCNLISEHGPTVSEFAPKAGAVWASRNDRTEYFLALPILVKKRAPDELLVVRCGSREYRPVAQEGDYRGGRWQGLAVYERRFRLKDVTGFRYGCAELHRESKLR